MAHSRHDLTAAERAKIAALYKSGVPVWAIAERFHIDRGRPAKIAREVSQKCGKSGGDGTDVTIPAQQPRSGATR